MPSKASARACRCGRPDVRRAADKGCPCGAVARACHEAGGHVPKCVRVAEMNVDVLVSDARCGKIMAPALPVWHGVQVAIDVRQPDREGRPAEGPQGQRSGGGLEQAARRKRDLPSTA